jgi:V8-like Glu-specific endopeptidase
MRSFEKDNDGLLKAGRCTSLLLIEELSDNQPISHHFGTAFFIGPQFLLTAGHCTLGKKNSNVRLTVSRPLGDGPINLTEFVNRRTEAIDCKVLDSLYKKDAPGHKDISLLHSHGYRTSCWLDIATAPIPLHSTVDVVGYPGRPSDQFFLGHRELTKPLQESVAAAAVLLPAQTLTITRGTVESVGDTISYRLATCPGMSGSGLLYQDEIYGNTRNAWCVDGRRSRWSGQ